MDPSLERAVDREDATTLARLASDDDLNRVVSFKTLDGAPYDTPLYEIMQHVITHGAYHRGQITGRLLDKGHEDAIVSTDLIGFYRERQANS